MKFPADSQLAGNLAFGDRFAVDCLLQRGVGKLSVPLSGKIVWIGPDLISVITATATLSS